MERLERDLVAFLELLQPRSKRTILIKRIFERVWRQKHESRSDEFTASERNLERLVMKKKNVLEQMASGNLAEDDPRMPQFARNWRT